MEEINYKKKGDKYKKKYMQLKYILDNKFYFLHTVGSFESLIEILKSKCIKPNKDIDDKYKHFSGYVGKDSIFMNIYFDDIKNITNVGGWFVLVINPQIIFLHDMDFYVNWGGHKLVSTNKGKNNYDNSINKIKDFLKHPEGHIPQIVIDAGGYRTHEITTKQHIPIKDIIGIKCLNCSNKKVKIIKKLLNELDMSVEVDTTIETKPFEFYAKNIY